MRETTEYVDAAEDALQRSQRRPTMMGGVPSANRTIAEAQVYALLANAKRLDALLEVLERAK